MKHAQTIVRLMDEESLNKISKEEFLKLTNKKKWDKFLSVFACYVGLRKLYSKLRLENEFLERTNNLLKKKITCYEKNNGSKLTFASLNHRAKKKEIRK